MIVWAPGGSRSSGGRARAASCSRGLVRPQSPLLPRHFYPGLCQEEAPLGWGLGVFWKPGANAGVPAGLLGVWASASEDHARTAVSCCVFYPASSAYVGGNEPL